MQLRFYPKLLIGVLALSICGSPVYGAKICEENELVGICSDNQYASESEFFDWEGNYVGSMPTNLLGYEIRKVSQGTLKEVYVENDIVLYKYGSPIEKVAQYPMDLYCVQISGNAYLLGEKDSQEICLYSEKDGYICDFEAGVDWAEYEDVAYMNGVILRTVSNGYYVQYIEPGAGETVNHHIVGISEDGWMADIVSDSISREEWEYEVSSELFTMGDYLIYQQNLYDIEGNCLLENVKGIYEAADEYTYNPEMAVALQINPYNLEYNLYDKNLNLISQGQASQELLDGLARAEENPWLKEFMYKDGVATFLPAEKLNQEICSGFIPYCGPAYMLVLYLNDNIENFVPFARTADGAYVSLKENTYFIPLEEDEKLISINDYMCVTGSKESYDGFKIRRLDTGEIIMDAPHGFAYLEQSYVMLEIMEESGFFDRKIYKIDKETYELKACRDTGAYLPWSDDCFVTRRSIYKGLTDKDGNWIARIIDRGTD